MICTALAIAAGILFAWLMARGLARDIRVLADFARRVDGGPRGEHCTLHRADELGALSLDINRMLLTLTDRENELSTTHTQVQANEERLRHALEGSNEGLWDWNLETGEVYLSLRWEGMLGFAENEMPSHFETWEQLLHPVDRCPANSRRPRC